VASVHRWQGGHVPVFIIDLPIYILDNLCTRVTLLLWFPETPTMHFLLFTHNVPSIVFNLCSVPTMHFALYTQLEYIPTMHFALYTQSEYTPTMQPALS